MESEVFLGLGSNLGDREAALEEALRRLCGRGLRVALRSSTWLTEPVGGPPQGPFLNAVVSGTIALSPEGLLRACLETEREMGRVRTVRDGPRTIDIDILFYGDVRRETPGLTIPHPRLHERRFVLEPLAELDAELVVPGRGRVTDLLAELD